MFMVFWCGAFGKPDPVQVGFPQCVHGKMERDPRWQHSCFVSPCKGNKKTLTDVGTWYWISICKYKLWKPDFRSYKICSIHHKVDPNIYVCMYEIQIVVYLLRMHTHTYTWMNSMKFMENRVEKSYSYLRADHQVYKNDLLFKYQKCKQCLSWWERGLVSRWTVQTTERKGSTWHSHSNTDAVGKTISEILHCAFFTYMYVINAFSSHSLCLNSFGGVFHTTAYSAWRVPLDNFIFLW